MKHYVYQIISLIPNEEGVCRIYSGLRSCECIPEEDTEYMGSGMAIRGAIEKYGRDKFTKIIIGKFSTREEAHDCETQWLAKQFDFHGRDWTKFNKFHYNLRLNENDNGGNFHSPEARAKMSAATIGENNPMFGKQHSKDTREKMSDARKGKLVGDKNPNFGKPMLDEQKKKLSEANSGVNNPTFKGLSIGTNKNNQTIVFCGEKDMKSRGFHPGAISNVINGNRASHKKFVFTRSTDPIFLQQLLHEDNFVDEESKQSIQQFLNQ